MPLEIIRNDITKVHADAIVNAANSKLQQGGGVCGTIFAAAGREKLQQACDAIGHCGVGESVITPGFALPSKFIIHTVGPVWRGGDHGEEKLLASCYRNSLMLAKDHHLESIAFPLISSGIFGYPKNKALQVAIAAIGDFLMANDMMVYLVVFDRAAFVISEKVFASVKQYVDDRYIDEHLFSRCLNETDYELKEFSSMAMAPMLDLEAPAKPVAGKRKLEDLVIKLDESFSQMLLRLIDEKGKSDVETYKKANIDRKLFSKIRSDVGYRASKATAIAFAIALELSLDETKDLLQKAGFALSHSSKFDIIIEYFITEGNYNIYEINETLFAFDQPLLGG
jgi:O-acetyl-ADP-ribose deacetylase (regulator of RNase III)